MGSEVSYPAPHGHQEHIYPLPQPYYHTRRSYPETSLATQDKHFWDRKGQQERKFILHPQNKGTEHV